MPAERGGSPFCAFALFYIPVCDVLGLDAKRRDWDGTVLYLAESLTLDPYPEWLFVDDHMLHCITII